MEDKYDKLKEIIGRYRSAVIAFSGGVDSTLLAKVTGDILNGNVLLVTATSSTYPFYELEEARELAKYLNLEHRVVVSEETDIPGFSENPPDRCYYCKSELFTVIKHIADAGKYDVVFDGSNADDLNDFRPGRKAINEQGVVSPLSIAEFTKLDIRLLSKKYKLPTAEKPAYACLASRFPYGEKITKEKLDRVGKAEKAIRELGFSLFRVRNHDNLARLEFTPEEIEMAWRKRNKINEICHKAGFTFIAIDLQGYRTGAMNEALNTKYKE